jgi:hypothetical protein
MRVLCHLELPADSRDVRSGDQADRDAAVIVTSRIRRMTADVGDMAA